MKKWGWVAIGVLAALAVLAVVQLTLLRQDAKQAGDEILNRGAAVPEKEPEPAGTETVRIRVVSDGPGAPPIEGARIEGQGPHGPLREKTGREGVAMLPRSGTFRFRIQAAHFVGVHLPLDLSLPDQTIVLKRTGSARFTAVGPDGKPVEGLTIRLSVSVADPTFLMAGSEPEKSTGPEGVARWEDLPPGAKAEWTVTSGHPIEPGVGIHIAGSKAVQLDDGRWALQSGSGSPFQAQGTFPVAPGEEFAITLKVRRTSTVTCRLGVGPDAAGTARVELWNKGEVATPSGTFNDHTPERQIDLAVGAAISIPNLTPGRKYIRAGWWDGPGRRAYARLNFDLNEGEAKDLGTLARLTGETLEVTVVLKGPPEAVERVEKPAKAVITFSCSSPDEDRSVVDHFEAEIGTKVSLLGLSGVKAVVLAMPKLKFRTGETVIEYTSPQLEVTLPSPPVEIPVLLEIKHRFKMTVSFAPLERQTYFDAYLIPGSGRAIQIGGSGPSAGATRVEFQGHVVPGEYDLLVHSRGDRNVYAKGTLTVRADGTSDLKLGDFQPGAILRGRAVTKSGTPYKDPVYFCFAGADQSRSIYHAEPDAEGRFKVAGIPPGTKLKAMLFEGPEIVVGEAGGETWVDLKAGD